MRERTRPTAVRLSPRGAPTLRTTPPRTPRRRKFGFFKGLLVVGGAIGLTTLAIHASDSLPFFGGSELAGVGGSIADPRCPEDMVYVSASGGGYCLDRYEASPGKLCPNQDVKSEFQTRDNIGEVACTPVSKKGQLPWVQVSLHEAIALCARVGKHLATPEEWYRGAIGTPDFSDDENGCELGRTGATRDAKTGAHSGCVSTYGVYDLVGNVWEWVDANVSDGKYAGRDLPSEGYVTEADVAGVAGATGATPSDAFGGDYWFVNKEGLRGVFRGGFYAMEEKAGIYSVNATMPPSFVGNAVGFRCAK